MEQQLVYSEPKSVWTLRHMSWESILDLDYVQIILLYGDNPPKKAGRKATKMDYVQAEIPQTTSDDAFWPHVVIYVQMRPSPYISATSQRVTSHDVYMQAPK